MGNEGMTIELQQHASNRRKNGSVYAATIMRSGEVVAVIYGSTPERTHIRAQAVVAQLMQINGESASRD